MKYKTTKRERSKLANGVCDAIRHVSGMSTQTSNVKVVANADGTEKVTMTFRMFANHIEVLNGSLEIYDTHTKDYWVALSTVSIPYLDIDNQDVPLYNRICKELENLHRYVSFYKETEEA